MIKCPKFKKFALGAFLLYEKDKCNFCNCSFTLLRKKLGKKWTFVASRRNGGGTSADRRRNVGGTAK